MTDESITPKKHAKLLLLTDECMESLKIVERKKNCASLAEAVREAIILAVFAPHAEELPPDPMLHTQDVAARLTFILSANDHRRVLSLQQREHVSNASSVIRRAIAYAAQ